MKFWISLLFGLALSLPTASQAAITGIPTINGTIAQPVSTGGVSYANYAGARSTLLVVKNKPGLLAKIINTNTTAQTATFTCFDNNSAASGTVLWAGVMAASQVVDVEINAINGITCISSAATLSGNGINVTDF